VFEGGTDSSLIESGIKFKIIENIFVFSH
jgi:hypothetical protein